MSHEKTLLIIAHLHGVSLLVKRLLLCQHITDTYLTHIPTMMTQYADTYSYSDDTIYWHISLLWWHSILILYC